MHLMSLQQMQYEQDSLNSPSEAYHGERSEFQLVQFGEACEVMEIASEGSSGGWNPSIHENSQIWRVQRVKEYE